MDKDELQELCGRSRGRTIVTGAANILRRTTAITDKDPLFVGVVLMCCLISVQLVLLLLVFSPGIAYTFARYTNDSTCRTLDYVNTSVYFVKHEDRSWTSEELCSIETAARLYPQFNIVIINLLRDNSTIAASPTDLTRRLTKKLSNVQSTDQSLRKLFAKSVMSKRVQAGDLQNDEIESAAKFQLIWDSPGISLEPLLIYQLESVRRDFLDGNEVDLDASIQIDADFQASAVPCHSFIGLVLDRMARPATRFADRRTLMESSLSQYCNRITKCRGVRIVKPISKKLAFNFSCPIIYSLL